MSKIILRNIKKSFGKDVVIPNLNMEIEDGLFTILVGPSGCGKTTTLRMIAGLEKPDSGEIYIGDKNVVDVDPGKRDIAMVFQNYALYPTMSVYQNMEFGLKNIHMGKAERERIIREVSEIVGLTDYLNRKPSQLSGGQRQRVALARAMVKSPKIFLMDEPLSNLDAKLRAQMRVELIELHKRLGTTFVYVTHDQVEAMSMGDRIALMDKGLIMQYSTPKEIYHEPQNKYTAQFIGSPAMNVLAGLVPEIEIGFRPERIYFHTVENEALVLKGTIQTKEQLGADYNYSINTGYGNLMVKSEDDIETRECTLHVKKEHIFGFDSSGDRIAMNEELFGYLNRISEEAKNGR